MVDDEHLVDVEGDAQDVAQEEHPHQAHEHHGQVVLLPTPSLNHGLGSKREPSMRDVRTVGEGGVADSQALNFGTEILVKSADFH